MVESATESWGKLLKIVLLVMISAPQERELVGTTGSPLMEEGKGGGVAETY